MSTPVTHPFLQVENLARIYPSPTGGEDVTVFDHVNFRIHKGEFVCVTGHSGCGKSTILNILAGLDTASAGNVFMDGREVSGPSLDRGVIFQSHALMPWLTRAGERALRGEVALGVVEQGADSRRTPCATSSWWASRAPSTRSRRSCPAA